MVARRYTPSRAGRSYSPAGHARPAAEPAHAAQPDRVSFPERIRQLARHDPEQPAVTCGHAALSRAQLDERSDRFAGVLRAAGIGIGDLVTIALPNSVEWFIATVACWKVGATPQPVAAKLPLRELHAVVEAANSRAVVGVAVAGRKSFLDVEGGQLDGALPDVVAPAWKAPTSGGSTGRPKIIVSGDRAELDLRRDPPFELARDGCLVMPGPLYHNGPLMWACLALLWGNHVVVLPRFDAEQTLRAVHDHRADALYVVPTMMRRIWRLPESLRAGFDLSSLRVVWHLGEPCPEWLKQNWIDWLGPERIYELYAGTEAQAATVIRGTEWLEHRGSVGRPIAGEIQILGPDGEQRAPGEFGEVWMRATKGRRTYRYIEASARSRDGGWESLGDMGWVDAEGFLYLGDRQQDMILSGGSNIYPAEVEGALQEHPAVRSCVVIGLPDDDLGQRVHAIVEPDEPAPEGSELLAFVSERLVRYKVPRSIEFVTTSLRNDAGKVNRAALRAARIADDRT
jgi:bile acid-coenzyme A ligase